MTTIAGPEAEAACDMVVASSPIFTNIHLCQPRIHKARKKSDKGLTSVLRTFIAERVEEVQSNPGLKHDRRWRIDQNDVFYACRPKALAAGIIINPRHGRHNFLNSIAGICKEFGFTREDLGIIAAERTKLFYNGEVRGVGVDEIYTLARKGVALIFIEKEGICESIAPFAEEIGVGVVHSRGFFVDYAHELSVLAGFKGAKLFTVTDFDVSGLLMAIRMQFVRENPARRIGIDFQTLEELGIRRQDVEEPYDGEGTVHYSPLKNGMIDFESGKRGMIAKFKVEREVLDYVSHHRIEINSVKTAVGNEEFWEWLKGRMEKLDPIYDYTRALDISQHVDPHQYYDFTTKLDNYLDKVSEAENERLRKKYKSIKGFVEVNSEQLSIYRKQKRAVNADAKAKQIMSALKDMTARGKQEGWWPPLSDGEVGGEGAAAEQQPPCHCNICDLELPSSQELTEHRARIHSILFGGGGAGREGEED
jgi:hypothetical protein